jgi:DNA-directed RNA polymerase specialized sigma24 family protein
VRVKVESLAAKPSGTASLVIDHARFDEFYRKYYLPLVRRSTWKHGLDKEDARDVVQEAFIVALAKLDPQRNPKAWLIQVVDHLSLNFRRKVVRRARLASKWTREDAPRCLNGVLAETVEAFDDVDDWQGGGD